MILDVYENSRGKLLAFISKRVGNHPDAEDLTQDVFVRMLEYKGEIDAENIKNFMLAIASNLINDYLRRLYRRQEAYEQIGATSEMTVEETEQTVIGRDMARVEADRLARMPQQRRIVYIMRIHDGRTSQEVAESLNISKRTAESHYYTGVLQMREYFRQCV